MFVLVKEAIEPVVMMWFARVYCMLWSMKTPVNQVYFKLGIDRKTIRPIIARIRADNVALLPQRKLM